MPYPEELVAPMRQELVSAGVKELRTAEDVERFMSTAGDLSMVIVNSVCGCAAGGARPGVRLSLQHAKKPARVGTVFAGQDLDAVAKARSYFDDIPPSSPSIAIFKSGELVHFVPRHMIEGRSPQEIAADLTKVYDEHA